MSQDKRFDYWEDDNRRSNSDGSNDFELSHPHHWYPIIGTPSLVAAASTAALVSRVSINELQSAVDDVAGRGTSYT